MTALFLSYSSVDRAVAEGVAAGLRVAGYGAVFLDVDPDQGIRPGAAWEQELYAALRRCDAVAFLGSDTSVTSRWCSIELALARSLNRPVFPLRVSGTARHELLGTIQEIDLADPAAAISRLTTALRRFGLDPGRGYAWDPTRSPYPGLQPFTAEFAAVFFGREAETGRLATLLEPSLARGAGRWVCIVGPSGSGKSSLLRAGLLPQLARLPEQWVLVPPLTPGRHPTERLARRLAAALTEHGIPTSGDELASTLTEATTPNMALLDTVERLCAAAGDVPKALIVLDQAEELVTRTGPRERQAFLGLLTAALTEQSPLWVVSTLRSEFLSTSPERAGLTEVIDDSVLIEPLSRARLAEVITRPAQRSGLAFQPGLVERMVLETHGGDALPLLAYTLHELTERRTSDTITIAGYEATGGVVGALQRGADKVLDELTRRGHGPAVLPTLLRLTTVDEHDTPVRQRMPLAAFDGDALAVVSAFVDARMLTAAGSPDPAGTATVEVAHEALLRQWKPLREAIESSLTALRLRAELGREAADWQSGHRDPSYLLRGGRLATFEAWAQTQPDAVEPSGREFLAASRSVADQELVTARRINRRLWGLSVGLAVFLVVALVAGGFAVVQREEARLQASQALARQLLAQAAQEADQPELALLLTVEAARRARGDTVTEAHDALVGRLNHTFHVSTQLLGHHSSVDYVAFDRAGTRLATASADGTLRLWDPRSGQPLGELPGTGPIYELAFHPDGSLLVAAVGSDVQLWDTATLRPHGPPQVGHTGPVVKAVFSPDGRLLASVSADRTVRLWDTATGRPHGPPLVGHTDVVFDVAFSPDGRTLATAGYDTTVRLWDVASGRPGPVLVGHRARVGLVSITGTTVVSADVEGTVRLWDLPSGRPGPELPGQADELAAFVISPDGATIATGDSRSVRLWNLATGQLRGQPRTGHTDAVVGLVFTPDGRTVISAGQDGTLRSWDTQIGDDAGQTLRGHTSRLTDVAISPDGRAVASASADGTARLWQVDATTPLPTVLLDDTSGPVRGVGVGVGVDGTVATAGSDGTVRLWQPTTGASRGTLSGHANAVNEVAFGPAGLLASGSEDHTVRLWDATTRQPIGLPLPTPAAVWCVAIDPAGRLLAASGADGVVRLWSLPDGHPLGELTGHEQGVNSVAFGPGGRLASGSNDDTVRLWDVASRRPIGPPLLATADVRDVVFSPDGRRLATAGADSMIQFRDPGTGQPLGVPVTGITGWLNEVAISPDGRTLASAADEGLQLWDADTGQRRGAALSGSGVRVLGVAFGTDADQLVSVGLGGAAMWNLHDDLLQSSACRIANRNLSTSEWERFLGTATPYTATCG